MAAMVVRSEKPREKKQNPPVNNLRCFVCEGKGRAVAAAAAAVCSRRRHPQTSGEGQSSELRAVAIMAALRRIRERQRALKSLFWVRSPKIEPDTSEPGRHAVPTEIRGRSISFGFFLCVFSKNTSQASGGKAALR